MAPAFRWHIGCLCALSVPGALGQISLQTVALVDQPVPGLAGVRFASFLGTGDGPPVIDHTGAIAFRARLAGDGVDAANDTTVLRADAAGVSVWTREGDFVDGGPRVGDCVRAPSSAPLISGGRVSARIAWTGDAASLFTGHAAPQRLGTTREAAPGVPGSNLRRIDAIAAGAFARTAWSGEITDGEVSRSAVFFDRDASPSPIAVAGGPAAGTNDTFATLGPCTMTDDGGVVFPAVTAGGIQTIYTDALGQLAPLVWTGQALPGGLVLLQLLDMTLGPSVSSGGRIVCRARTPESPSAIVTNRTGEWTLAAYEGMTIPGTGMVVGSLAESPRPAINDRGDVMFVAPLDSVDDSRGAIVLVGMGSITVAAMNGDALPGTTGVRIESIEPWTARLNARGEVAFVASLEGTGVTATNDRVLLVWSGGELQVVAREGAAVEVLPGVNRAVAAIGFSNAAGLTAGASGTASGAGVFNDSGTMAFLLRFTDGTEGVFRASTGELPPACDPDVNCDGAADQGDVACMILAVAGDAGCFCEGDVDFNRDGATDQGDVADVVQVVAGAPCP